MRSKAWYQAAGQECDYRTAMASTAKLFQTGKMAKVRRLDCTLQGLYAPSADVQRVLCLQAAYWAQLDLLPPYCSLFARKFGADALDAAVMSGQDCEAGFAWSPLCASS